MEMDEEIIHRLKSLSHSEASIAQLQSLILSKDDQTILHYLDKRSGFRDSGQAMTDYIRAIFTSLGRSAREDESSRPAKLLLQIVLKFLSLFISRKISNDRKCTDLLDFIVQEVDAIPKQMLPYVTELICSNIDSIVEPEDGHELRVLPRIFRVLPSASEVKVPGQDGEEMVSLAVEYAGFALKRILHAKWSKVVLTRMVSILREFQLDKSQVEEYLTKVFSRMKAADPQDLPSLVYQLLLFASKGLHKKWVLGGVLSLFGVVMGGVSEGKNGNCNSSIEVLRQVEGTVLLHINFAIKQDPSLGQELLSVIRADQRPISPFTVSLLLSVARIQRFEEASLGFLRTLTIKSHQDYRKARECGWLPDDMKVYSLHIAKAVEQALVQVVQYNNFGQDHIIPSVVKIGFTLLESVEAGKSAEDYGGCDELIGLKELGILALRTAFEVHDMARNEIIEQSKICIISLKPQHSSAVIRLLAELVQRYPHLMLEHVARLKESLDYFTFLNSISASSFIRAICPLFQMSRDLQNYTLLVLRKAIFGREEAARVAATTAIIDLIISEKQLVNNDSQSFPSSSQASCSQQVTFPCALGLNLFQELKGLLRRCLSQQARVKEAVYRGLVKLVLVDPSAAGPVFDLLWPHFLQYCISQEDGRLYLKLGACVKVRNGTLCLEEPLDYLLSCVRHLLLLQPQSKTAHQSEFSMACFGFSLSQDNEVGVSAGESFAAAFPNLRQSFRRGKLEDYSLDKTQNFSLETPEGEKNVEQAQILMGILEVLMDIVISDMRNATDTNQDEAMNELIAFLEIYDCLEQSAVKKQGSGTRKGTMKAPMDSKGQTQDGGNQSNVNLRHGSNMSPSSPAHERTPFLMTSNIGYLLEISLKLIKTDVSSNQATSQHRCHGKAWNQIPHHLKLVSFALKLCLRHLKAILTESFEHGQPYSPFKSVVNSEIKLLGSSLLQVLYLLNSASSSASTQDKPRNKENKGKKTSDEAEEGLVHTTILCMDIICKLVFTKKCLTDVLDEMISVPSSLADSAHEKDIEMADINESEWPEGRMLHQFLWKKIHPLLVQLLTLSHFREFEVLSCTALFLGGKLPLHLRKVHGIWAELICRSTKIMHNAAARALATLAVYLSIPPLDLNVGQRMAYELLKVMGSEERDPTDVSDVYVVINASTKNGIANLILHLAESTLVDVDWLISKLKIYPIAGNLPLSDATNNRRQESVSRSALEETLQSRVESLVHMLSHFTEMSLSTVPTEHFLRVATKLYKNLAALTKLCIAPKGYKQSLPSSKFQMLAEVTCRKLTAPLYNFMAVMQRDQQENVQAKGLANKIKREFKTIPNLIFHIEDYEKYLIQLSKLTKVNLMRHAKRSTARDFKIIDVDKKKKKEENDQAEEPNQADAAVPDNESEEESQKEKGEGSECVPSEGNANSEDIVVVNESESDSDGNSTINMNKRQKRKIANVVQDSDEE